jgi:hypothetical protein
MLNEIETNIAELLTTRLESARKVGVQRGVQGLTQPAVYVSAEAGTFERQTQWTYKHTVTVYVDIIFSSLKDQKSRRDGINLILEGALQLLLLNTLGLAIDPLKPKSWRNTTTEELDGLGLISYSLELTTSFLVEKQEEEVVTDLLTVGLTYYLQEPDDETADAADVVNLPELPKG